MHFAVNKPTPPGRGIRPVAARGLAAGLVCVGLAAAAAPVTFEFTGLVTDDAINGCNPVVVVACGAVTGSYRFDSAAVDGNSAGNAGQYAASTISFSIDGTVFFSAANGVINVANFTTVDQYGLIATGTANGVASDLSILLEDANAAAFGSDALPLTPSALSALLPGRFTLFASDDSFQLQGSIDAITCTNGCEKTNVPEPGSALLLTTALAALGLVRRCDRPPKTRQRPSAHPPAPRRPT